MLNGEDELVAQDTGAAIVLVDWENVRYRLRERGWMVAPSVMLRALLDSVPKGRPPAHLGQDYQFQLHFPAGIETRLDRQALRELGAVLVSPWKGRGRAVDKNLADIEMVLAAAEAYYESGDADRCVFLMSNDRDVARAAAYFAERYTRHGRRGCAVVLYCGDRPQVEGTSVRRLDMLPGLAQGLGPAQLSERPWHPWDGVGWRLHHLGQPAKRIAPSFVQRLRQLGSDDGRWAATYRVQPSEIPELELLDAMLAELWWELGLGAPFTRAAAALLLEDKFPAAAARAEAFEALVLAGFVRGVDSDRLEVPRQWAEGLFYPLRRMALRLGKRSVGQDQDRVRTKSLQNAHRKSTPVLPLADPDPKAREHATRVRARAAEESFDAVGHALERLGAIASRGSGRETPIWWLRRSNWFLQDTLATARSIRNAIAPSCPDAEAEARVDDLLTSAMPARRWLFCLQQTGILEFRRDTGLWRLGADAGSI
jgi:hypothetical protein